MTAEPTMRDEELYCVTFIVALLLACSAALGGCALVERTNQVAIQAGLVQENHGSGFFWTKPESK